MSYGRRAYEPVDVRSLFWVKKVYGMQDSRGHILLNTLSST